MGDIIKDCEGVLKMSNTRIELGDMVKDTITGFQGIATKWQECLGYQNRQISVLPTKLDDNGYPMDEVTFSEERLVKV